MPQAENFGIEVNFLTGRYVSTSHNDRNRSEWPPHPARLFSALVAAWADADEPERSEREALEWLETLAPPAIAASDAVARSVVSHFVPVNDAAVIGRGWQKQRFDKIAAKATQLREEFTSSHGEVTPKTVQLQQQVNRLREVEDQVQRSGTTNPTSALRMLPEHRGKQERFFPSMTPDEPRVTYMWNGFLGGRFAGTPRPLAQTSN